MVEGMCLGGDTAAELGECSPERLVQDAGAEGYARNEMVGANYPAAKSKRVGISAVRDYAVNKVVGERGAGYVDIMNRTNKLGKAHRVAITANGS